YRFYSLSTPPNPLMNNSFPTRRSSDLKVEKEERSIDYAGSGLFFIAVSSLMVLFIEGGTEWEWLSGPTFILLTVFMIGMAAFLWREKKAFSPMMPLRLWQDKL